MLNELSCWYVDWAAIGTWVGGLGTTFAAMWGVYAAVKAWESEKSRRQIKIKAQAILMVPELAHTTNVASALLKNTNAILADQERLSYVRSRLAIDMAKEVSRSNVEMSEGLAVALSEFVVVVSMLQDSLDRWSTGPIRSEKAVDAIHHVAKMVVPKAEKLAAQLAHSALGSRELLDEALKRQEEGVR